jgi:molybdopterin molybdotransferase
MAIRVRLQRDDGAVVAIPNGPQASHIMTSLLGADALALIGPGDGDAPAGTTVRLEPLPS